jgi:peptidoglycan hydrolase-like protein with peptidoglycan-binding domain
VAYTEALHKRGTGAQGGQFVTKGAGGQTTTASHIGYDGKGRGTGYGAGSKGDPNVSALQKELNRLGIVDSQGNQLKVDGKFGPKTTSAVRRLQARLGLGVDGKVTPALLAKLKKMKPSAHDSHSMHVRHLAAQHKQHSAHAAHEKHAAHQKATAKKPAPARKTVAPARRKAKARTGMGANPKAAAQHPSSSARASAARKNAS